MIHLGQSQCKSLKSCRKHYKCEGAHFEISPREQIRALLVAKGAICFQMLKSREYQLLYVVPNYYLCGLKACLGVNPKGLPHLCKLPFQQGNIHPWKGELVSRVWHEKSLETKHQTFLTDLRNISHVASIPLKHTKKAV